MKFKFKSVVAMIAVLCLLCSVFTMSAFAKGSTSIAFSKSKLNVGDTLTVTVRFTATEKMYGVEAQVHYDNSVLQYVSAPNGAAGAAGIVKIAASASSTTASETITFKAIKAGTSSVKVDEASYVGDDQVSVTGCSANISVVDKSASKSSNANLKYITPSAGTLSPKFSADVTTYSITIPNNVKTLTVGAGTADSSAKWDVEGSKEMKVGANKRVIVVTASDGTVKRYTLNITRLAEDGTTPPVEGPSTENPTADKITVTADGKDKLVSDSFDTSNLYSGYSLDVCNIGEKEAACIKRGESTLVYLTDIDGQNGAFFRMNADGSFSAFKYLNTTTGFYEFLETTEVPNGYSQITLTLDGAEVTAYQNNDPLLGEFVLVYAMGPGGYVGFYRYDTSEKTMQRAIGAIAEVAEQTDSDGTLIGNIMALDTSSKIIAVVIVGAILLLITAIIVLIVKIARPSVYEEEIDEIEEEEEELDDGFEMITISDRDENTEE